LLKELSERLEDKGFTVLTNKEVPVNDGGLSLGQAYWGMHNT
jgi:hydrogenase maturation factor HypF (carbamoyltransferase family)